MTRLFLLTTTAFCLVSCSAADAQKIDTVPQPVETQTATSVSFNDSTAVPPTDAVPSWEDKVRVETWLDNVDQPWGMTFMDADTLLMTQKSGQLFTVTQGVKTEITGVPTVNDGGQGGLLDVALDPEWPTQDWIYLALSDPKSPGARASMTKIIRAKVKDNALADIQTIWAAKPEDYIATGYHFGSRITFDAAGHLYFSIGDRGRKEMAQDIAVPNGKVHRVNRDGSIPADNPFVETDGAYASIYSYGNRNPQGLIVHPDSDVLWSTEHGPKGGDELNIIQPGVNYGWPEISYGINYNGTVLTKFKAKKNMAQPEKQWTPSIAVCGLDVYTGDLFPDWKGHLLVGALAYETVRLVDVDGRDVLSEHEILSGEGRVRDVTTGPDGAIYVATPSRILRLSPEG